MAWKGLCCVTIPDTNLPMKSYQLLVATVVLGILGLMAMPVCGAEKSYQLLKEIPVGGEGGWDYLAVDQYARRLYVTHDTKLVVIDMEKESVVAEIADTPGVHGFAIP